MQKLVCTIMLACAMGLFGGIFLLDGIGRWVDRLMTPGPPNIVRVVRNIHRNRSARQTINDTGRVKYSDVLSGYWSIVDTIPVGNGSEETELIYFKLDKSVSNDQLAKEYQNRGLVPDPQAQVADNEADPAFADTHFNETHWPIDNGWGIVTFYRNKGERYIGVGIIRDSRLLGPFWWYAGRRKP